MMKLGKFGQLAPAMARAIAVCLFAALLASTPASSQEETPEWRIWTSSEGAQIEAYFQAVEEGQVVIVRRDGQQFTAPLERFSEEDRQYVASKVEQQLPSASEFRAIDFAEVELPDSHQIEGVGHVRQERQTPLGSAALQMILEFHGVPIPDTFFEQLGALEQQREEVLAARDIQNALQNLPVETEVIRYTEPGVASRPLDADAWEANINAIRTALHWNLPVLLAYRLEEGVDSLPNAVVAVGYDRRRLDFIDPDGSRSPVSLDIRDLELRFIYAIVLFPAVEAVVEGTQEEGELSREFLSAVSNAIRQAASFTPVGVTEQLADAGLRATIRNVNREDLGGSLGQTRSFARSGGLSFIDTSLEAGNVVVVPQELGPADELGFALIYGRDGDNYLAVTYTADRRFIREPIDPTELARRWLTREDRTYRLDLIEIKTPPTEVTQSAPTGTGAEGGQGQQATQTK